MAAPKSVPALYNYDPQPTPLMLEDMPRYTQNELLEVSSRLNVLTETFMPNVTVALTDKTSAMAIQGIGFWDVINDYLFTGFSDFTDYIGIVWDQAAGTIGFSGTADEILTVEISANLACAVGTLPFNTEVRLRVNDTAGSAKVIGADFIGSNLQTLFNLNAQTTFDVKGNSVLQLEIEADSPGSIPGMIGTFQVRPVTNKYLVRPGG